MCMYHYAILQIPVLSGCSTEHSAVQGTVQYREHSAVQGMVQYREHSAVQSTLAHSTVSFCFSKKMLYMHTFLQFLWIEENVV